jgi:hypothetical protein
MRLRKESEMDAIHFSVSHSICLEIVRLLILAYWRGNLIYLKISPLFIKEESFFPNFIG